MESVYQQDNCDQSVTAQVAIPSAASITYPEDNGAPDAAGSDAANVVSSNYTNAVPTDYLLDLQVVRLLAPLSLEARQL